MKGKRVGTLINSDKAESIGAHCELSSRRRCGKCIKASRLPTSGKNQRQGRIGERWLFWRFCCFAAANAKLRAKKLGLPGTITNYDLDRLLIDQGYRCAVSGITLRTPRGKREPFTPSIDRIVPALGYVPGNIRIVCVMINFAMNNWGEETLRQMVKQWRKEERRRPGRLPVRRAMPTKVT